MKIRDEDLVPVWVAAPPEVFAQEPAHVQEKFGRAVAAARQALKLPAPAPVEQVDQVVWRDPRVDEPEVAPLPRRRSKGE